MRQYVLMGQRQWGIKMHTAALTAGVLAAAVLGGACADPNHTQTVNVVQASAAAMTQSQSVEITSTLAQPGALATTERMIYDFQSRTGEIFQQTGPGGGFGPAEVILAGQDAYLSLAGLPSGLVGKPAAGKKWLMIPSPSSQTDSGPLAGLLDPMASTGNMATLLSQLAPIVQSIQQAGTAVIDGIETTRYDVTLNAQRIASILGGGSQAGLGPAGPLQLWIDSQGRVRRLQLSFTASGIGKITETSDYTNFGVPLHITIPPASQVETMQQFAQNAPNNSICTTTPNTTTHSGQAGLPPGTSQVCSASSSSRAISGGGSSAPSQP
jgi:hypothetical protein